MPALALRAKLWSHSPMTTPATPTVPATNAPADAALGALLSVPPPVMEDATVLQALHQGWGLTGTLSRLTSERDLNLRLDADSGRYLVKLTNPVEPVEMTDFQTRAFLHVAARDPGVPASRLIRPQDGAMWLNLPQGKLRLFSWQEGTPLHAVPRSDAISAASGAALGRLTQALADFDHPAADHILLWDIKQLPRLAPLLPALDADLRAEAEAFLSDFATQISHRLPHLPIQICHADFNPHNLLVEGKAISGILDFGDMVRTPRICDLAVAASYQIDPARPLDSLGAFLSGYARHQQITLPETELLFDLIIARMITTLAIAGWRASLYPENAPYILRNAPSARAGMQAFRDIGRARATDSFARALRRST